MLAATSGIGTSTSTYCMYKVFKGVAVNCVDRLDTEGGRDPASWQCVATPI